MILGKRLFIAMLIDHLCKIIFPSRSPLVRCEKEGLLCIPNHDRQNVRTNSEKRNEKRSDKGEVMITIECDGKIYRVFIKIVFLPNSLQPIPCM